MLEDFRGQPALILAIPAGGVPVAVALARSLKLPLDVAVVSKITLPWNPEAGYGAVAFDGTVQLNQKLIASLALTDSVVRNGIDTTRAKVEARVKRLHANTPMTSLADKIVILVDDGLASGYTMTTAIEAVRRQKPREIVVAVPTAHAESARRLALEVDALYCTNLREGRSFAVADAYEHWSDIGEDTAEALLRTVRPSAVVN